MRMRHLFTFVLLLPGLFTAALANRVVLEALSAIARKRRDAAYGTSWDPATPLLADRTPPRQEP